MDTKNDLIKKLQHRLAISKEQLAVLLVVSVELEKWDGRKPNARVEKEIQAALPSYHVYYTRDKMFGWHTIRMRRIGDMYRDMDWTYNFHYDNDGEKFSIMKFLERNEKWQIQETIADFEVFLADDTKVAELLAYVDNFNEKVIYFHNNLPDSVAVHYLDERRRKLINDTRFTTYAPS